MAEICKPLPDEQLLDELRRIRTPEHLVREIQQRIEITKMLPLPDEMITILERGMVTSGSRTTIFDGTKDWDVDVWDGALIKLTIAGQDYTRAITANIEAQLTFNPLPPGVSPKPGQEYIISPPTAPGVVLIDRLVRWGKDVYTFWVHAAEVVAPAAGTALVTRSVLLGTVGHIYGFFIACQEANDFLLNWTSGGVAYSKRLIFGAGGTCEAVDPLPLNETLPADEGTDITITNVNAGGAGMIYQANLLYAGEA